MLKRGHVYKLTYKLVLEELSCIERDNMIISPDCDISNRRLLSHRLGLINCLFHINLGNDVLRNYQVGISSVIKAERPTSKEDFEDIEKAMKMCGLTYNKDLNRIEGYEGMRITKNYGNIKKKNNKI